MSMPAGPRGLMMNVPSLDSVMGDGGHGASCRAVRILFIGEAPIGFVPVPADGVTES